jgi:hypothetical protein
MLKKLLTCITLTLMFAFIGFNFPIVYAAGTARVTAATCDGLTIQGTSKHPYISVLVTSLDFSRVLGVSDGPVVSGPRPLVPVGLVAVNSNATFSTYVPFRNPDFTIGPVPSYTSMNIVVYENSSLSDGTGSEIAQISLSVVCPFYNPFPTSFDYVQRLS